MRNSALAAFDLPGQISPAAVADFRSPPDTLLTTSQQSNLPASPRKPKSSNYQPQQQQQQQQQHQVTDELEELTLWSGAAYLPGSSPLHHIGQRHLQAPSPSQNGKATS